MNVRLIFALHWYTSDAFQRLSNPINAYMDRKYFWPQRLIPKTFGFDLLD